MGCGQAERKAFKRNHGILNQYNQDNYNQNLNLIHDDDQNNYESNDEMNLCESISCERKINKTFSSEDIDIIIKQFKDFLSKDIIQTQFFDAKEKIENDSIFVILLKEEKEILINFFNSQKEKFLKIIKESIKKINLERPILNSLVLNILDSEKDDVSYLNKLKKEIKIIKEDKNSYKIDYLTVILVGKSGVGKSTLINNFLKLEKDQRAKTGTGKFQTEELKPYQSSSIPFLRLVDTRGIELNINYGSGKVKQDVEKFIINQLNENNPNNFVHCIWYCITGNRFEQAEIDLLNKLKETYEENKIPIIIVYTQATDEDTVNEMEKYIKENDIDAEFIKVLAEDKKLMGGGKLKAFGLDDLMAETLYKCKKAFKGDMLSFMTSIISKNVLLTLKNEIKNKKILVKKEIILNFLKFAKVKNDEDFKDFIITILGINTKYFFNKEKLDIENIKASDNLYLIINPINNFINTYKKETSQIIKKNVNSFTYQLLELQVDLEIKNNKNMKVKNKRNLKAFKETVTSFLNYNFYYLAQKYCIGSIIENINYIISDIFIDNIQKIVNNLISLKEIKVEINECFFRKFQEFEEKVNKKFSFPFDKMKTKDISKDFDENDLPALPTVKIEISDIENSNDSENENSNDSENENSNDT